LFVSEITLTFASLNQIIVELKNNGMNNILSKEDQLALIQSKIYVIRGQKVMLDFDLAEAYGVETSQLKRQVRRNIERFEGDDFMIELTRDELSRCQIGTLNIKRGQNIKYLPFAFTELGVAMLSSVLKSPAAIKVNRDIMRAFVAVRQMVSALPKPDVATDVIQLRKDFEELKLDIEDILHDQNDINESTRAQLDAISTALAELQAKPSEKNTRKPIGFIQPEDDDDKK
jgi:hypothetical protein